MSEEFVKITRTQLKDLVAGYCGSSALGELYELASAPPQPDHSAQLEPDFKSDANALEIFSKLMAHKLAKKAAEGRGGWQDCSQELLTRMLREHVEKGDPVDVANFCMMLCANGMSIDKAQPLDTVQGDAQAVPLPGRATGFSDVARGWNKCLDAISKLGPLYTYADAGEVERLREELQERRELDKRHIALIGKRDEMKRRLATAEQLLRDYYDDAHLCAFKAKDIDAFLSASAKPEGGEA